MDSGSNSNNNNNNNSNNSKCPYWTHMYNLLVEYRNEHKSTIVPDCCDNEAHLKIGHWVKEQRKRNRMLTAHQKQLLNDIDFVWDYQEAQWLEKYERLCDYESKIMLMRRRPVVGGGGGNNNGNGKNGNDNDSGKYGSNNSSDGGGGGNSMQSTIENVSSSDLESVFEKRYNEDPILRRWVGTQRQKYRKETISLERVKLLDQVEGFVWDVKEARWFEMYRRLSVYAKNNNQREQNKDNNNNKTFSCIVPQNYQEDPQLACWVSNQRQRKHHRLNHAEHHYQDYREAAVKRSLLAIHQA